MAPYFLVVTKHKTGHDIRSVFTDDIPIPDSGEIGIRCLIDVFTDEVYGSIREDKQGSAGMHAAERVIGEGTRGIQQAATGVT